MAEEDKELPDEKIQALLKQVVDHYDKEDRYVRERQIRQWKKLKYYWSGFQRLWWSEVAHDWRVFDVQLNSETSTNDASFYDKPINIFRAYLESIIAALSITIPPVKCYPDDADNPLDVETAKAGDKIAELIYKHNDVSLLWLHALYIYCTEGLIAAYCYTKEDDKYGTYESPDFGKVEVSGQTPTCPTCGSPLGDPIEDIDNRERNEFGPDEDDVVAHDLLNKGQKLCPKCLMEVDPEFKETKIIVERQVGVTQKPKSRQCIECYGGLYVKVPNYAIKQADCPYLIFSYETHYAQAIERYPHLKDKFGGNSKIGPGSGGMYDPYERWGRLSTQYYGEYPINTTTIRNSWLRPCAFNVLDKEEADILKKEYPDGVKVVMVNDDFAEAENESLDDCWTLTQNPLSDYLHHDPLGQLLTTIQEITNDITSLTLQTIEHGIPQTFADPGVLNFDEYGQTEVTPGQIYPAKPSSGKGLGDAFYEVKTAQLSGEVLPFANKIQEAGQLVSGALPSLFGGAAPNSSKTASQYAMSRAQAQQRLQTPWRMLTVWWKNIFGKAIPAFIKDMAADEKIVSKDESGNFVNVFIRKSQLQGKIGSVEIEANDQLPIAWAQKKDVIMQLIQMNNPELAAALMSPENLPIVADIIGLPDFIIPGEDDRQKQYEEIRLLLDSVPIQDPQSVGGEAPSINVEPLVDNHSIEADICRRFLVSSAGRLARVENPDGYKNVLLHMKRHMDVVQAQQSAAAAQQLQSQMMMNKQMQPIKQQGKANGSPTQQSVQ